MSDAHPRCLAGRRRARSGVIVGAGYLGLEMAEALMHRGLSVTLVKQVEQPLGGAPDLAAAPPSRAAAREAPGRARACLLRDANQIDAGFARAVADTMRALATPSRVRILGRLHSGASSVNELADAVGMEASAVSHQLRLLRHLGFVVGRRDGRRVVYDLHDDHVAHLLDEAISHVEHLQLSLAGRAGERDDAKVPA